MPFLLGIVCKAGVGTLLKMPGPLRSHERRLQIFPPSLHVNHILQTNDCAHSRV